jgi:hypothetical protein
MRIVLVSLIVLLYSVSLQAKTEEFQLQNNKIKLELDELWKPVKDFLGVELMIVGPMKSSNRPVVTVSSTDFAEFNLDSNMLQKNELSYKEGRENWLKKQNAQALEFYKYEFKKLKNNNQLHSLGYRYRIADKEFIERSHYIVCKNSLFHFKSLVLASEEEDNKFVINNLLESFICE